MASPKVIVSNAVLNQMVRDLVPQGDTEEAFDAIAIVELTGKPGCRGAAAVREWRARQPNLCVVAVAGADSPAITQQAVRLGVDDYFRLPQEAHDLQKAVAALLAGGEAPEKSSPPQNVLLGSSNKIASIRRYAARVAMTDSTALITGETGTGKELVAELIHKSSARRDKPFVCVNSAAVPDTLLESELFGFEKGAFTGANARYQGKLRQAHTGTLFFDEVGELSLMAQAKVLRAIESREVQPLGGWRGIAVDIRLIAATNRNLDGETERGDFRRDLFYRLNVARIDLPPLRERKEDIPQLLKHFVEVYNRQLRRQVQVFDPVAVELLQSYHWPGNIRELRNVVEASFIHADSDRIEIMHLPEALRNAFNNRLFPDKRARLIQALLANRWNVSRAASEMSCSRMTLYRKMAQYGISPSEKRALAAKA